MEKQSEHGAQTALFRTVAMHETQRPELGLLFAIPNGGKRDKITAAKLKAEGVKAGVPDLMLPVARGGYHGLFIELKVGDNRPSQLQKDWIVRLQYQGYYCAVCWDWTQAVEMFLSYLDGVYTL